MNNGVCVQHEAKNSNGLSECRRYAILVKCKSASINKHISFMVTMLFLAKFKSTCE